MDARAPSPPRPNPPGTNCHRAIRTVLHQALGRQGHTVRSTGAAATLWQWVQEGEGQLVITDVVMPDENGLDLVPRIRKLRPDLRIIVMSAQSTLLTAVRATERGAFEYLPKPFDLNELISVVNRALSALESAQTLAPAGVPGFKLPFAADERLATLYGPAASFTLTAGPPGSGGTQATLRAVVMHRPGEELAASIAEPDKVQMLAPLDHAKIPNLANLSPRFQNPDFDPGLKYSAAYFWGTQGLGYRISAAEPTAWADIMESDKYAGRISLLNDTDIIRMALKYLGHSLNTADPAQITAAQDALIKAKAQESSYQATLQVAAKILPPSLLDYLR